MKEHKLLLRIMDRFLECICMPQEEDVCTPVCSLCLCRALARAGYLNAGLEWVTAGTQLCCAWGLLAPAVRWFFIITCPREMSRGRTDTFTVVVRSDARKVVAASVFYPLNLSQDESSAFRQHPPTKKMDLSRVHLHSVALSVSKLSVPV